MVPEELGLNQIGNVNKIISFGLQRYHHTEYVCVCIIVYSFHKSRSAVIILGICSLLYMNLGEEVRFCDEMSPLML